MYFIVRIILLFCVHSICVAGNNNNILPANYSEELGLILKNYQNNAFNDEQLEQRLKLCSDNGNPGCTYFLCDYYYTRKLYSLAYTTCSNIEGNYFQEEKDFMLGYLLTNGLGILQNKEKGLEFYINSVAGGDAVSAWNISVVYTKEMATLIEAKQYNSQLDDATVNAYAWAKVAQALGYENYTDTNGVQKSISTVLNAYRAILTNISRIDEADTLAKEICSQIKKCNQ
ncbi:hypothetical protein [Legionella sp.]|uniref:hypothetical protein n=1 Tax=Legionella sp. TaxID=459 RepID=UPI003CAE657F